MPRLTATALLLAAAATLSGCVTETRDEGWSARRDSSWSASSVPMKSFWSGGSASGRRGTTFTQGPPDLD